MTDNASAMANSDRQKQYEQGLFPHIITGNPQGENLILLAGYPDDELSGWAPLIDLLKHKYQIISVCFPQVNELRVAQINQIKISIHSYNTSTLR